MSSNTSNYQEYTFTELLEQYDKILVPMIQRDYAQGRTDKKATDVRNNLLNDVFGGKGIRLDLVFGSVEKRIIDGEEKNCFIPVDGQQRLTTLFLLYLYEQKQPNSNLKLDLSKFSYDTRRAASDFCKSVTSKNWSVQKCNKVSEIIKDSTWFMDYWAKDPTVEGMLNMLDAIHEKSKGVDYPDLSKVTFYFFDLASNGLNENLYLKMNSRGKPLTAFENLKAKIEKVLPDTIEIEEKCFPKSDAAPKDSFKKTWKYFMDRDWTETFWDKDHPAKYDVNITKCIVRFLSGYWAAFGQDTNYGQTTSKLKDINRKEKDDNNYADFIPFEPLKNVFQNKDAFLKLAYALTVAPTITPYWTNDTIKVSDKSEYKLLAVVFTYILFDGDESSMRFAWNMAENFVTDYDTFVAYCKRAGEMYQYKCKENITFYQTLSSIEFAGNTSDQMKEEIAKAKQILNGEPRPDGKTWEEIIIEAEKYGFFKGAIRFLFTKESIGDDWEHFDKKWENARVYFDGNGVKDGNDFNRQYKTNSLLMKSLLANCDDFWNKIWRHFEFSNDALHWKRILISNNWRKAVDVIMGKEITSEITKKSVESITEPLIKNIVDDGLMDYVCNYMSGAWIRSTYHGYHAIWQSGYPSRQIVLNPILAELKNDSIIDYNEENRIKSCRYYKYKNVDFKYNGYFFRWCGSPNNTELDIYLMENDRTDHKKRTIQTSNNFSFAVGIEEKKETFLEKLDGLITALQKAENELTTNNEQTS